MIDEYLQLKLSTSQLTTWKPSSWTMLFRLKLQQKFASFKQRHNQVFRKSKNFRGSPRPSPFLQEIDLSSRRPTGQQQHPPGIPATTTTGTLLARATTPMRRLSCRPQGPGPPQDTPRASTSPSHDTPSDFLRKTEHFLNDDTWITPEYFDFNSVQLWPYHFNMQRDYFGINNGRRYRWKSKT